VTVWRISLDAGAAALIGARGLLSATERERAARFHRAHDAARWILAHGALRRILAAHLGCPARALVFRPGRGGKPVLAGSRRVLEFNLTHSHDLALVAVASGGTPVGIDVERLRPLPDAASLMTRFFSPSEQREWSGLEPAARDAAFFRAWTRKEAVVKATGDGLSAPFEQVSISAGTGSRPRVSAYPGRASDLRRWHVVDLQPGAGYAGALAMLGLPRGPLELVDFDHRPGRALMPRR